MQLTGAVIGVSSNFNYNSIIGLIFIVFGLVLFTHSRLEEKLSAKEYFNKRAHELTGGKGNNDLWISQWEIEGLKNEFKKMGFGVRYLESHIGGKKGPTQKHINICGRNENGYKIKRHLFITYDPYDSRIEKTSYGFKSKYYSPFHPRN